MQSKFLLWSCPFLAEKITPAIPAVGGLLLVFVLATLFRTSFSDPGVIPRATADEAADIEKQIGNCFLFSHSSILFDDCVFSYRSSKQSKQPNLSPTSSDQRSRCLRSSGQIEVLLYM